MEIEITSVGDKGDINNERIGLTVLRDCELKYYLIFKTSFSGNGFFHITNNSYWFTPRVVKSGDKIVLYTKNGQQSVKDNSDGSKTYFYYWGLNSPIFTDQNKGVVLAEIKNWQLSKSV